MKNPSLILTLLTLALVPACGMVKNMEEMHDSTAKMSTTTSRMAGTTASMAEVTSHMAETTSEMAKDVNFTYFDMRIGNTRQARQEALNGLSNVKDIAAKMGYASEYFAAMEYQFWKPSVESLDDREALMALAVKDFFKKAREYIVSYDQLSPALESEQAQNLYALVATLHYVNLAQTSALKDAPGLPTVTLLSLLEDGLKAKSLVESGKVNESQIPAYQLEVLRQEQEATYLLRLRQNFLKAFAFMLAATESSGDEPGKLSLALLLKGADWFNRSWVPNFNTRNSAQINYNAIVLEYALETQIFLSSLNIDPKNDRNIQVLLSHVNVDATLNKDTAATKVKAITRFKNALGATLKQ